MTESAYMSNPPSKVVFVGNVPYNMGEEQLIDIFKTVGQVVGFRLVFDRETGKPRGYGFCEFTDHATAASAVRNLNNVDVGGRNLRIDLADSDPYLEGKTTVRGELIDAGESRTQWREREKRERDNDEDPTQSQFLNALPPGIPLPPGTSALDAISQTLATMNPTQLTEVLAQMKAFVINHPEQARILLVAHPQLAYALFQALLLNKIVDPAILQRMLAATTMSSGGIPQPQAPQMPQMPPNMPMPQMMSHPNVPPSGAQYSTMYPPTPQQVQQQQQQQQQQPYYRPPPPTPQMSGQPSAPVIEPGQRDMIMQVLALSPEQINGLPQSERDAIHQLRNQFIGMLGNQPSL